MTFSIVSRRYRGTHIHGACAAPFYVYRKRGRDLWRKGPTIRRRVKRQYSPPVERGRPVASRYGYAMPAMPYHRFMFDLAWR